MADVLITKLDGKPTAVTNEALSTLSGIVQGKLFTPGSDGYDQARTVWNAMIDRRPAIIVQAAGEQDIRNAVRFAREHQLLLAIKGAGHNIAGNAVCDDGMMLDLSGMKRIEVDSSNRTVKVQPGVTLGELDRATQEHGLAVPVGINSTTGIAGLTLGGGFGWLSRKHGMTVDNLLSARVVTADGELLFANVAENPDLFWGIRGGGGNFGVVTEFTFRLVPVGPEVLSGLIVHPLSAGKELFRFYREFARKAPDDVTVWVVLRKAPPLPFIPEEWHGREVFVLAAFYAGEMASGEDALRPLRQFGDPIADVIGPHPFTGWQSAFDPLLTPGARNYWKSHDFTDLDDALCEVALSYAANLPDPNCEVFFGQVGGAQQRVPQTATAYNGREANFVMNVHGRWNEAADDDKCIAWCRGLFADCTPFATGAAYVNFLTEEESGRVKAAYGPNYDRLLSLKRKYDPTNLFRMNQNISPD